MAVLLAVRKVERSGGVYVKTPVVLSYAKFATPTALTDTERSVSDIPTKSGMPIGIQLIGPPKGDALVLQVGLALERALNLPKTPIDPNLRHL